jgi:serine/threonine protein kinase
MEVSHNVGVIRCETTEAGGVKIFAAKGAGKGSFLTAKKMVDFGSVEKIVVGNKAYAYLKLHDLKRLSPKAAKARIEVLKQEIATLHDFADKGVKNMMKLIEVKYEVRKIGKAEVEVPVGIMVEWCNLGDAEWITKAPPKPKTQEYIDCVFIARDVAVGVASLHANETVQGDLKPANILLSTRGGHISAVVGDPGSCVKVGQSLPSYSPAYAAPEMLEEGGEEQGIATKQSDVWSFGVSLLEMFHGEGSNEFATISSPEQMEEAHDKIIARLNMDNDIDALIYDCLQASSSRPTMQEVVDRLNAILSKSPPSQPQKPLSSKAQAQLEARTEQRFIDWKRQAKEVEVVAT